MFTVDPSAADPVVDAPIRQVQPFGRKYHGGVTVEGVGGKTPGVRKATSPGGPTSTLTQNPTLAAPLRVGVLRSEDNATMHRIVCGPLIVSADVMTNPSVPGRCNAAHALRAGVC